MSTDTNVLLEWTEHLKLDIRMTLAAFIIQRYFRKHNKEVQERESMKKRNRAAMKLQR